MTNDFHFDTEIIIKLHHQSMRILEVPIPTYYGTELCSVDGLKYAKDVVRSVWRYRRTCRSDHGFHVRVGEGGMDRKRDHGLACVLGDGEVALPASESKGVRGLEVQRDRVVDASLDASGKKMLAKCVATLETHRVDVA